jgi:hypothetical protein
MFQKHFGPATSDDFGLAVGPFSQLTDTPLHHDQELQCGGGGGDPFQSNPGGDHQHHENRFLESPTDLKNAIGAGLNDQFGGDHLVLNSREATNCGGVSMEEEYQFKQDSSPPPATPTASSGGDEDYMYATHCHSNLEIIKVRTNVSFFTLLEKRVKKYTF